MTQVNDSKGVQTGSGNVQINLFSGEQPRGPVVAGNVPQAPPACQPRVRPRGGGTAIRMTEGRNGWTRSR
jgi:hypothetical protein